MLWGNSAGAPLLEKAVYFDEELPYCSEDLAPPKTRTASLPHLTKKRLNCLEGFFFFSDCVGCSLLWGFSLIVMLGLLIAVAFVVAEHWL